MNRLCKRITCSNFRYRWPLRPGLQLRSSPNLRRSNLRLPRQTRRSLRRLRRIKLRLSLRLHLRHRLRKPLPRTRLNRRNRRISSKRLRPTRIRHPRA